MCGEGAIQAQAPFWHPSRAPHRAHSRGRPRRGRGWIPMVLNNPILYKLPLFCHLLFVTLSVPHLLGQAGAGSQPVQAFLAYPSRSPGRHCTDLQYHQKVKRQKKRKSAILNTADQGKQHSNFFLQQEKRLHLCVCFFRKSAIKA